MTDRKHSDNRASALLTVLPASAAATAPGVAYAGNGNGDLLACGGPPTANSIKPAWPDIEGPGARGLRDTLRGFAQSQGHVGRRIPPNFLRSTGASRFAEGSLGERNLK